MVTRRIPDNGRYQLPYAEALIREGHYKDALEQTELGSKVKYRTDSSDGLV